ncbi:MAG TPA: pilus assembly PilX N-terminal domain-containing protein [Candidatus Methylomirabilis sp.]|nr:pilus assembly PilX N-terminal domain-containing protein [Candidatus Methylomirabilis sp.]
MKLTSHRILGDQRGLVFVSSLVLVAVMTLLGLALFDLAVIEGALVVGDMTSNQLLYCAEAALGRTMEDGNGRMAQITGALQAAPGSTLSWNETVATNAVTCTNTITFTDDVGSVPQRRLLRATAAAPNGTSRSVRVQLNFLAPPFAYVTVGNNGDFYLGGVGSVPHSGPGGADIVNGDIFVAGRVFVGTPSSACAGSGCAASPSVTPRSVSDTTPTISLPTGTAWTQAQADNSSAWPSTGDSIPFGYRSSMPQPDVTGWVGSVKAAAGMSSNNLTGNMTGTFQGSPVLNVNAAFAALGANSDGSLRQPSGCNCGAPTGNCAVYCQLQPLGVMQNPPDRATENGGTPGPDFYFDGVHTGEQFSSQGKTGQQGAQRLLDFGNATGQPSIIFVDGNVWFNNKSDYGFAINGRATIVSTNDITLADNLIYKNGLSDTGTSTADMLGLVAQRDVWYGDPRYGTFYEGAGVMLAGRDFNFVFLDLNGNQKPPDNAMTLNGSMLANRQVAIFRDFANTGGSSSTSACDSSSTNCQAVSFDPTTTSCGSANGCWRFLLRSADGSVSFDTSKSEFKECVPAAHGGCNSGTRVISHFQMTLNYDNRLFTNPTLVPPGLPNGGGVNFANSWKDWQECPPCP